MSLTLITGPANAAKAGAVLDAYGELIARAPILVVPNFGDVDFYRRDLADRGEVFGTDVVQFRALIAEIGRRVGVRQRPLGRLARRRVASRAIADTELDVLARASATAGFADQLIEFAEELEAARIAPQRLLQALRAWGEGGTYAEEVGRLYGAYRSELERIGRPDRELAETRALDALRERPGAWGDTPVLFYGFDELDPIQLDAVETLARHADVWFSLTYEPGREALAARAGAFQDLAAIATARYELPAVGEYYGSEEGSIRAVRPGESDRPEDVPRRQHPLHHVERGLFEPAARRVAGGGAVALLEGGGERAEVELVAGRVRALIADGVAPEEIAVVHRDMRTAGALIERVFATYDIPVALRRRIAAGHTALGRGVLAALRCALGSGTADDLVTYLRTPGLVERIVFVDALEAQIRRTGVRGVADARDAWEQQRWPLNTLDRIAAAARAPHPALCERLATEVSGMFARPFVRQARVLEGPELISARTASALAAALRELAALPPRLAPSPRELADTLAEVDVFSGADPGPGRVTVAAPLAVRARRVHTLFAMGMAQGTFPRPAPVSPFFDDAQRRAINSATGLRMRLREQSLQTERFFFYVTCSRPRETLVLSWPAADDEGRPQVRSLFVDDLLGLLTSSPKVARRALGEAGWTGGGPSERERRRAEVAAAPGRGAAPIAALGDAVLVGLRERGTWSASALEAWMGCPVKWFVERHLRLDTLEPDPEALLRGGVSHTVLEQALSGLGRALTPEDLPRARELLHSALTEQAERVQISVNPERMAAELRRLEVDLLAYLEHSAANGSTFVPQEFELSFGAPDDPYPPLELAGGHKLQGRIDRIDVSPDGREAIVWDYKGRGEQPSHRKWGPPPERDGKIQIALYMLAAERVLGLEPVGGLYQRLKAADPQPRGMVIGDADPDLAIKNVDRVDAEAARDVLELCEQAAVGAIAEIRAGLLQGRPRTCAYSGGCSYPSICRCEETDL